MSVLWRCDDCGGPAWWTIDQEGEPWYLCKDTECRLVEVLDFWDTIEYLDKVGSVSALVEGEGDSDVVIDRAEVGSSVVCNCLF